MNREAKILQYIEDWNGGFYDSHKMDRKELIRIIAENVLCWHDLIESRENMRNYSKTIEEMAKRDAVIIRRNAYTDTWILEIP